MTDRERWDLRGAVRTCWSERTRCSFRGGGEACEKEERGDATLAEFRPDGALRYRRHNNPDGSEWVCYYDYTDSGRLLAIRHSSADGQTSRQDYEYDAAGRPARLVASDAAGQRHVAETYSYDAAGRKSKTVNVDRESQKPGVGYFWGVEGVETSYSAQGCAAVITHYDERERPSELVFRDAAGELLSRVSFRYDAAGRLIEEAQRTEVRALPARLLPDLTPGQFADLTRFLGAGKVPNGTTYRYNERGCRVERVRRLGGVLADRETAVFNEQGDKIASTTEPGELAGSDACEALFRYQYDGHGNWVEKITEYRTGPQRDFNVSAIERRTLTYFDIT